MEAWSGVKVCDTWGDQVMQEANLNPVGGFWGDEFYFDPFYEPEISEEGLNLNIYTPANYTNEKLPVLVWFHGGGNNHGNASEMEFNASQLAEKGIIVVSVQYRVSMFGFMALDELSNESANGVSGNYLILDLVKSLKWVNQSIEGFGGDPNQVTIDGQSAGAQNVTALLRTPLAKGLFNKAIIQSSMQGLLTVEGAAVYKTLEEQEAACKLSVTSAFGKEMTLAQLRAVPAETYMTQKIPDGTKTLYAAINSAAKALVIDGYVYTKESVDLMREGALDGIDIMIGGTSDERASLSGIPTGSTKLSDFATSMTKSYGADYIKGYAPKDETEAYRLSLRSTSDNYLQKNVVSAEYVKEHNDNMNVYTYYFNHTLPGRNEEFYGSFHSSDLWYMFSSLRDVEGQREWTEKDYQMADIMSSYWAKFVKSGNPNGTGLAAWNECKAKTNGSFMRFADGAAESVINTPYAERDKLNLTLNMNLYGLKQVDLGYQNSDTVTPPPTAAPTTAPTVAPTVLPTTTPTQVPTVPAKVANVKSSSVTTSTITLTWSKVADATSYSVLKYDSSKKTYKTVKTTSALSYKVIGLSAGKVYQFKVVAYNGLLKGTDSAVLKVATDPKKPTLTVKKTTSTKAKLSWKSGTSADSIVIYMKKGTGNYKKVTTVKASKITFTKTGLVKGTKYSFKIRGYKSAGSTKSYSSYSAVKTVK